jgi:iron-sulfur cluster insertion protein
MEQVNITDDAYAKIKDIMLETADVSDNVALRVFVQGGGCSGMQYGFTFDEEQNEDDFQFEKNGVKVLIDSMSISYLSGATINYKEDLAGSSFVIDNPAAKSTCGCGSSFNPG